MEVTQNGYLKTDFFKFSDFGLEAIENYARSDCDNDFILKDHVKINNVASILHYKILIVFLVILIDFTCLLIPY